MDNVVFVFKHLNLLVAACVGLMTEVQRSILNLLFLSVSELKRFPSLPYLKNPKSKSAGQWRCYEVHDIIIECSRLSLDPLESSCEEDVYYSPPASPKLPPQSFPHLHLDLSSNPHDLEPISSSGISVSCPPQLTLNTSYMQADDLTWSPSSQCGLSTPPPEAATSPAPSLSRSTSISGVKCPSPASVPVTMPSGDSYQPVSVLQVTSGFIPKEQHEDSLCLSSQVMQQPIRAKEEMGLRDVMSENLNSAGEWLRHGHGGGDCPVETVHRC
ncbi:hypothetical protein XENOCAPTIV_023909 [Xenoophorus captivus]|uniref:Uncharacterized protein n=1 Tax=Xenoophorus captivus TaxID=1517983 RepID=A0ABV0S0J6_9TELE